MPVTEKLAPEPRSAGRAPEEDASVRPWGPNGRPAKKSGQVDERARLGLMRDKPAKS